MMVKITPGLDGITLDFSWISGIYRSIKVLDKKRPYKIPSRSLAFWLSGGVGVFVLSGSVALLLFFQHLTRVEEAVAFESQGRANALFLDQTYLPQSDQMADQLGRVMGARVEFREGRGAPADGRARRHGERLMAGFFLKNGREVWFSREVNSVGARAVWRRMDAWLAMGGFWALSLGLTWVLGSRVTRPLARLAAVVPGMGGDKPLDGFPVGGPREIVQLAGTLRATHDSLVEEREKRKHAERLALLGQMVTGLAHEIRNPVSAIRLHGQLLEASSSDEIRTSAELIVGEAGRIESLVSQWLHYAKPKPVVMNRIDLPALVSESCRVMAPRAAHAGVEVVEEIDSGWEIQPVLGDRDRLHQVLDNLLLNAIQSMPNGGKVCLRVLPGCLVVEDEGGGFSQAALDHFGEPFYSEREGGMGLGLAVSKEIVESHGATLQAGNRSEGGARVEMVWSKEGGVTHG
jgi:signal transduction histidine kinase